VSNKNKSRRRAPASQARASQARTSQASASQAAAGQDGDISQAEADAIVRDVLSKLWEGVASGDPLRAELETATCMAPVRTPVLVPFCACITSSRTTMGVAVTASRRASNGAASIFPPRAKTM